MNSTHRFGRRVALPSTRQITHELRMMIAADRIRLLERDLQNAIEAERLAGPKALPAT